MYKFDYDFKKINSKQIVVCEEYQRLLDFNRVKRIVKKFNPNKVREICVSYREGKYWCFDGQHTLAVLKTMNGNKDLMVSCKVYYGMKKEDEALMFSGQCDDVVRPVSEVIMKAKVVAKDEDTVAFKKCVESCNIRCDFTRGQAFNKLICYSTAFQIFKKYGEVHLRNILTAIVDVWGGDKDSMRKEIVGGFDVFFRTYADEFSMKDLTKRLRKYTPNHIIGQGNAIGSGGYTRYAIAMLNVYNANTRTNRLEYKFK